MGAFAYFGRSDVHRYVLGTSLPCPRIRCAASMTNGEPTRTARNSFCGGSRYSPSPQVGFLDKGRTRGVLAYRLPPRSDGRPALCRILGRSADAGQAALAGTPSGPRLGADPRAGTAGTGRRNSVAGRVLRR